MRKLLFAAAVAAAVALPSNAFAGAFSGVVVGNSGSHVAVATKSGVVRTVNTRAHRASAHACVWPERACA
jgi:hypothetical protein